MKCGVSTIITDNKKMKKMILLFGIFIPSFTINAQIVYTDLIPDTVISATERELTKSYFLDLDNNGVFEIELRHFNPGGFCGVEIHRNPDATTYQDVIYSSGSNTTTALSLSFTIGPNSSTWGFPSSNFLGSDDWQTDKYMGIRFQKSGEWYYGWVRIVISPDKLSFTVKDYAYNQQANEAINAGQNGSGINEYTVNKNITISIHPNPVSTSTNIHFSKSVQNATLKITNVKGQEIKTISSVFGNSIEMDRENLSNGIYIIQLIQNDKIISVNKFIVND